MTVMKNSANKQFKEAHPAHWVFGPVQSRRLGASLGIDCVPFKTCNYDCIYCELGRTIKTDNEIRTHVPITAILNEVGQALNETDRLDYITIAGAGEPTLYAPLGDLISAVKDMSDTPVALLTNGSLLSRKDVRQAAARADLVIPSLDAGNEKTFTAINRPHPDISFTGMAEGICRFRDEFSGALWLEVFLIEGFNTDDAALNGIRKYTDRIAPDLIHLNTTDRKPSEPFAKKVNPDLLRKIKEFFGSRAQIA